jgi:stearoyl-CoA desaturase (delta-9 desaturase)
MRIGVIRGGMEVEIWKREHNSTKDAQYIKDENGNRVVRAGAQVTKVAEPVQSAGAA